jgi:hydrogenase small subunit
MECTGCTETLLRTTEPDLAELLLELISLDYHETLAAAAGHQAEAILEKTLERHSGKYVLVVEGAVPLADGGIYCKIGGRTASDLLERTAAHAAAIVAVGSCASFGGIAAAEPNPTGAVGVPTALAGRPVLTLPGCPPNPRNLLGTLLQLLIFGEPPALDSLGRPLFAYGRTIHEHCPRRPHFDAGRFAQAFGDESHRAGHCLYELGCKGPATHANCSTTHFCEVDGAWPIGIGHPCVGCTERDLAFRVPLFETIEPDHQTPPASYATVEVDHGGVSPVATGFAGLVGGVLAAAAWMTARRIGVAEEEGAPSASEAPSPTSAHGGPA